MKRNFVKAIAIGLVISGVTSSVANASTIIDYSEVNSAVDKGVVEARTFSNSYFAFKNIWGGSALKLEFDNSTMKINAVSQSGNFGNSNDNFIFKVIDRNTKEAIINESAASKYVGDFVNKVNGKDFKYGDIISLNIASASGLKSPTLFTQDKSVGTNCVNKSQYFEISEEGIVDYIPDTKVSPLKILGAGIVKETTLTGVTAPKVNIKVVVEGREFKTISNENGEFSVNIESNEGFTAHTKIEVNTGEIKVDVYPEVLNQKNLKQETNTGYSYILNADLETLTTPFDGNILYGRSLLSENGKKAWDIAYKSLLKYDNTEDKYPRDSAGNVEFYMDYESHGITISEEEAQYIQKYLFRNDPRMFLLKDWGAKPVYKNGVVVGQKFYIGNGSQNGDEYKQWLLQTEEAVSYILSKVTPDMNLYQIIKTVQSEFENMVSYKNVSLCGDMRGTFITKEAICGGYAKGFEYLLLRLGIENAYVNGHAGGPHAWNNINLYGNWYVADSTWGGKNWYLRGYEDSKNHAPYDTYHIMPKITADSIPWNLGDKGQSIANLTGIVNYENNNAGTVTITYEDKNNVNKTMHINTSLNEYKPLEMKKDKDGVWSATISYENSTEDIFDFYFTVDGKFNTLGNVKANNLTVKSFEQGMKNIVLSKSNVTRNDLKELINKCNFKKEDYTKTSFENYKGILDYAVKLSSDENASSVDIALTYKKLKESIDSLIKANEIEFKGYNNEVFLKLNFDTENKRFIAASNGKMVHPYQYSRVYVKMQHFDKKGNLKNEYSVRANDTADKMAEALNKGTYVDGDYLKLSHLEQNGRLVIKGYVENSPKDLSTGALGVDLANSFFYLGEENLKYSNVQLDLSADKTELINKINEMKIITQENYTKTSYSNLKVEIEKAEAIVNSTNVLEEEVTKAIEDLNVAKGNLRELNEIIFKGYNNNEFLKLSFDNENKIFKALSNGEVANRYVGGKYIEIVHCDQKGNEKGRYSIRGSETADDLAAALNNLAYVHGDYLKLYHSEKNGRLVLKGYIENVPFDLGNGVKDLDLSTSLFYLNGDNFKYSSEQLDLSADKTKLIEKIKEAKKFLKEEYTKTSYGNLLITIKKAEEVVNSKNVLQEEITKELEYIENAIINLREINKIEFKGYNNVVFMTLEFDTENKRFVAASNGKMVHPYQYSRVYIKVQHFDKKGNLKNEYSVRANDTADKMAEALNKGTYVEGDYLKLSHLEQNGRLVIKGYVENSPKDLSTGALGVDLASSFFYLGEENLKYSNVQLDLSADKTELINKINEMKIITQENYTKTSYSNLKAEIEKAEAIVNSTNVLEEEVTKAIEDLNVAKGNLRELNEIIFKGYNNNEFLKLSFDNENKIFKALSNSEVANRYVGGKYIEIVHCDQKGNEKGRYSIRGSETADDLAAALNNLAYVHGDYLKLYHGEKNNRLAIKGYINNLDTDLSKGVGNLDLSNAIFILEDESLTYKTN